MLKKMLIACGGLAIATQALAQVNPLGDNKYNAVAPLEQQAAPVSPVSTYVGEANGMPLVVQFTSQNGSVAGRIIIADKTFNFAGRDQAGYIDGVWGANSTQRWPIQAIIRDGQMKLTTNGQTYTLSRPNAKQDGPVAQPSAPVGFDIAGLRPNVPANQPPAASDLGQAELNRGQYFNTPVVRGWKVFDAPSNAVVISPDGKSAYGVIGSPVAPQTTPEQFLRQIFQGFGVRDLQILSSQNLQSQNGQSAVDALVSFTGTDGTARKGLVRAAVMTSNGAQYGFFQHAATPVDRFETDCTTLATLASQIRLSDRPAPLPPARERYDQVGRDDQPADDGRTWNR